MSRPNPDLDNAVLLVLDAWPEDPTKAAADDWITEADLSDWLTKEGALPERVTLGSVLSYSRRQSWVLRNRHTTPETFKLTPKGEAFASAAAAIAQAEVR